MDTSPRQRRMNTAIDIIAVVYWTLVIVALLGGAVAAFLL